MKQGEIWLINLDPAIGAEIKKVRPAIIVNDNSLGKLPLKIIVPVTEWKEKYEIAQWMIKIEPDKENNLANCFPREICKTDWSSFRDIYGRDQNWFIESLIY
jgi:mRNA-degrading endonuclease toxin of MazEF toxin-antitoxin module